MLLFKKRSRLKWFDKNHFVIFSCLCWQNQFPRSIMLWFPSFLNRCDISSIVTMAGMTVNNEVNIPACCRVKQSLKTTMQIMNTKGTIYNDASKIMLINNLSPWIITCSNKMG